MDKLIEQYTIKIPYKTKKMIEEMSPDFQRRLREDLRLTMARVIHEWRSWQNFKPEAYLSDEIDLELEIVRPGILRRVYQLLLRKIR